MPDTYYRPEDLGKFASWQFRLLETQEQEILKSSTLDYMQKVHWTDPDWETTRGLGFSVGRNASGETVVEYRMWQFLTMDVGGLGWPFGPTHRFRFVSSWTFGVTIRFRVVSGCFVYE